MWLLHPLWLMNFNWQPSPMTLHLRFEKETRFYTVCLEQDLFEDWVVMATNGSMRSKVGTSRTLPFDDYNSALAKCYELVKVRHQHKYQIIKILGSNNSFMLALLWILENTPNNHTKKTSRISKQKILNNKQFKASNDDQISFDFG